MNVPIARALGALVAVALAGACVGASRVTFVDSSVAAAGKSVDTKIADGRVDATACGPAGVARIETYFSIGDRVIKALTASLAQGRHARIVCAGGQ